MEEAPTLTEEDVETTRKKSGKTRKRLKSAKKIKFLTVEERRRSSAAVIDWDAQDMDTIATYIQAGYRGMKTREDEEKGMVSKQVDNFNKGETRKQKLISDGKTAADSPEIVVKQATESESEYSYTYVDEDEEEEDSGSLTDRPDSPVTAISEINIAGFRATAMIGSWLQRRKQRRPIMGDDEDDCATKIQAGYRGMITREQMKNKDNSKMIELRWF